MQHNAPQTLHATARFSLALLLSCALSLGFLASNLTQPATAFAETTEIDAEPNAAQQEIERTAMAYDNASAHVIELEQQITNNESKIKQLEADLPTQQERGSSALRALYKLQQDVPGLIEIILNSASLNDFLTTFEYIEHVQQRNLTELSRLQSMKDDLDSTQIALETAKQAAVTEQANAQEALAAAQAARQEAQRKAQEEAARQAEEAAKAAEAEQLKQQQAEAAQAAAKEASAASPGGSAPESGSNGNNEETVVPTPPGDVDWDADKTAFVAEWSSRIDAYLAGSPLSGQGTTFAEAAWTYGVDPRWSPAISNTESSKGLYCFASHNAWGWGSVSWGSWEEAINSHVRGLANGYGYTLSVEAAKKYCPPNWEHWYNVTLTQMNMI